MKRLIVVFVLGIFLLSSCKATWMGGEASTPPNHLIMSSKTTDNKWTVKIHLTTSKDAEFKEMVKEIFTNLYLNSQLKYKVKNDKETETIK